MGKPGGDIAARSGEIARLTATGSDEAELFDHFPYGLFTADASGRVLSVNRACRDALPQLTDGPAPTPVRCCDLICSRLVGDDEPRCLTEDAIAAGETQPEIRVDIGPDQAPGALWVTVSPLGDNGRVVFHLRPGEAGDRRRRTEVQLGAARLRVFALGPTRVETSVEGSIGGTWIEQRPGQVLKFLVCTRGRIATAEEIAHALWPEAGATALNSVRYFIHILRTRLEPAREARERSRFIESRRGGYSFDPRCVWLDVTDFEQLVGGGLAVLVAGERTVAMQRLERAINLYRDDFLSDEPYSEWALAERNRLRELAARCLSALVELRLGEGDINTASRHARHLADIEPYDSDAQRRHIELSLRRGRRSEAMRRYDLFRRRLQRDFNEEPDFQLVDLLVPGGPSAS